MNDNLNKFEKLFNYNLKIKKILHESSFEENIDYTKDNRNLIEYKEKLVKNLEELEFYIMNSMKMFDYNEYTLMNIQNKFNLYRKTLINLKTETKHLKSFYTTVFSDMSKELIENLSKNCKGYYLFNDKNIITEATTINEMLHCIHHSITNDKYYYQSMPLKCKRIIVKIIQ